MAQAQAIERVRGTARRACRAPLAPCSLSIGRGTGARHLSATMQAQAAHGAARPTGVLGARASRPSRLVVVASAAPRDELSQLQASRRQALVAGLGISAGLWLPGAPLPAAAAGASDSIYGESALMFGEEVALEKYKGQVGFVGLAAWLAGVQPAMWQARRQPLHASSKRMAALPLPDGARLAAPATPLRRCCLWSTWRRNDPCRTSTTQAPGGLACWVGGWALMSACRHGRRHAPPHSRRPPLLLLLCTLRVRPARRCR